MFLEVVFTFCIDFYYKHSGFCYHIKEMSFCIFSTKPFSNSCGKIDFKQELNFIAILLRGF